MRAGSPAPAARVLLLELGKLIRVGQRSHYPHLSQYWRFCVGQCRAQRKVHHLFTSSQLVVRRAVPQQPRAARLRWRGDHQAVSSTSIPASQLSAAAWRVRPGCPADLPGSLPPPATAHSNTQHQEKSGWSKMRTRFQFYITVGFISKYISAAHTVVWWCQVLQTWACLHKIYIHHSREVYSLNRNKWIRVGMLGAFFGNIPF